MAPVAPLGKKHLLALLAQGRVPVFFGSPHPHLAVVEQDGVFRVRALVVDPKEASAESARALAAGRGWMPENHYALGRPTGPIAIEAPTLEALREKIAAREPWPADW